MPTLRWVMMNESPDEKPSEHLVEPSRIEPQTEQTQPDAGTKLFVAFFFLLVPLLGLLILGAVFWTLYKMVLAA